MTTTIRREIDKYPKVVPLVIFNKEGRREGNEYSCHGWRKFKDADDQQQSPVYVLGPS